MYLGEYQQAIADSTKAIELDPNHASAYVNRGIAYAAALGEYEQAIADYTMAIKLDPDHAEAYINRGTAYTELGEKAEAVADFEEATTLTDDPQLVEMAEQALEELGE